MRERIAARLVRRFVALRPLLGVFGLGLCLLGGAQCKFSPDLTVNGGALKCEQPGDACPPDHTCNSAGYCCKAGDKRAVCGGDGGAPDINISVPDTTPAIDMGMPVTADADPGAVLPTRRIVAGTNTHLIGFDEACTRGIPASTPDRWCAFTRGTELWVLNVTRASTTAVPCNGTDPGCRMMTNKLFLPADTTKTNAHTKPRFYGDLLIYYAEPTQDVAMDALYRGGVFGWHPTFTDPRRLTGAAGNKCESHPSVSAPTAWCIEGAVQIHAGAIKASEPLPLLWTLTMNEDRYLVEITRAGDKVILMQRPAGMPAALSLIPAGETADATKRLAVAPNILAFEQSTDSSLLYLLRNEGNKGGLFSVDMATGTKVTEIAPNIEGFSALSDDRGTDLGLVIYDAFAGETANARLLLDPANPAKLVALGRIAGVGVSPDKAFSLLSTVVVTTPSRLVDAKLFDNTALTSCGLQAEARSRRTFPFFSSSGRLVFWLEPSVDPAFDNVWVATAKGCNARRMVTGQTLSFGGLLNDAIIYKQRNAPPMSSTLHYQRFSPDTAATVMGPVQLHEGVGLVSVIEPARKLAVFSSTKPNAEGIFVVDLP